LPVMSFAEAALPLPLLELFEPFAATRLSGLFEDCTRLAFEEAAGAFDFAIVLTEDRGVSSGLVFACDFVPERAFDVGFAWALASATDTLAALSRSPTPSSSAGYCSSTFDSKASTRSSRFRAFLVLRGFLVFMVSRVAPVLTGVKARTSQCRHIRLIHRTTIRFGFKVQVLRSERGNGIRIRDSHN
jgi:hypothetical protein